MCPAFYPWSIWDTFPERRDVAENTRRFLLSEANPYYFKGDKLSGIGSPHTPSRYVWHIAAAMEGLTLTMEGKSAGAQAPCGDGRWKRHDA